MMAKTKQRVLSGVQPSGAQVHLGNYLGAMRRFVTLAEQHETFVCLVDLHALTSVEKGAELRRYTQSLAAAYLAIGLDPKKVVIFRQSDVIEVCELAWYLSCQFPLGLLERAHALKDARAKNLTVNSGLMLYPILMAADILLYRATHVPVGADQKQHLEMTREVAQKFNAHYGDLFPVPEPLIDGETGVIPGLDGRKMSKSYNNYIGLFEQPDEIRKKVMRIVTDSRGVEEVKDPEQCNVFRLFRLVATGAETAELSEKYRRGGMGYGVAKEALFEVLKRELAPLRESYEGWLSKPKDLDDVLAAGAAIARDEARRTMANVRAAVGTGSFS